MDVVKQFNQVKRLTYQISFQLLLAASSHMQNKIGTAQSDISSMHCVHIFYHSLILQNKLNKGQYPNS